MKTKYIPIVILILLVAFISYKNQKVENLALKDVSSIEFHYYGTKKLTYIKDENLEQMKEFISMYNKAKYYDNTVGTTPSITVLITLTNEEKITVWGGTQGFQTVEMKGKQFNIKGKKLGDYFKELNKQYDS
ncbi:hypothetical protein SH2C18_34750 [Clostridium sediminicola]|uniref:hypothetical protein n=1 Tax=Clostridium sediminicola TaxID=3114879 RepID=UPI0031F1FA3A